MALDADRRPWQRPGDGGPTPSRLEGARLGTERGGALDSHDPWMRLRTWMEEGSGTEPRVPEAMQLATDTPEGVPSIRTVLLKGFGPDGLVFYTNLGSRKALELAANPVAAALLHFKGLERQVIAHGPVKPVSDSMADAYFATRPRGSRIGAWASRQSSPVDSRAQLEASVRAFEERFEGQDVPRPTFWSGFCLQPERLEFWQGRPSRLHDRWVYTRSGDGWEHMRLAP